MTRVYFVRHAQPEHDWEEDRTRPLTEEGKKDSVVPYIIELDFESSCNATCVHEKEAKTESECPLYSFKLAAKQEHCHIEKEFKGR